MSVAPRARASDSSRAQEGVVRLLSSLPLLVVALELGVVSRSPLAAGPLVLVTLLVAMVGPRAAADVATQRLVSVVLALITMAVFRSLDAPFPEAAVSLFWIGVATASLLVASFRLVCAEVEGDLRGTVVLAATGLLACGAGRVGRGYGVAVVAFFVTSLWAFRARDGARPKLASLSRSATGWLVGTTLLAALVAASVVLPMRPAAEWMRRRALTAYDEAYARRGGRFADSMRVGRIDPMLRSDAVALRLRGPRVDLLRAVVFDRYEAGRFFHAVERPGETFRPPRRIDGPDVVEVTRARAATDRVPLPLGAADVASPAELVREPFGVMKVPEGESEKRYLFRAPRGAAVTDWPPGPADLEIPDELRPTLSRLALEWTAGATDPAEIVARIEARLRRDYTYELGRDHLAGRDPLVHFLLKEPAGHCEYFAGAAVLLARARGVPARLAAGYRVNERNPLDGHYVVRERNAHAWMEVWTSERGWTTVDPTPLTEDMRDLFDEPTGTAAADLAAASWDRAESWLADRSVGELVVAALFGTALFVVVRIRRARRERAGAKIDPLGEPSRAEPYALGLLEAMAERGRARRHDEPIERFAARVGDEDTAALLLRYAAVRYGAADDPALPEAMRARAKLWRTRPPVDDSAL